MGIKWDPGNPYRKAAPREPTEAEEERRHLERQMLALRRLGRVTMGIALVNFLIQFALWVFR